MKDCNNAELKVGDTVLIVKASCTEYNGKVGVVTATSFDGRQVEVKFYGQGGCGFFSYKLKKITPEEAAIWLLEN